MKKLISVLICISMLLSVVPMVSQAVEVTTPVFVDFEDYVAGESNSYKDGYIVFPSTSYETPTIDAEHGKSIKLYSPATGSTEYMNLASELTENAVFGFSYYSDDSSPSFVVSSKVTNTHKNEKGWIDVNSIATINGSEIKVGSTLLSDFSYTKGTWINFAFAMDYVNHKVDVYINGKYAASHTPKTSSSNFLGTDRFNLSIVADKRSDADSTKAAALIFDNVFAYYPADSFNATVTGLPDDSETQEEITVDFGQNVILPTDSYVKLNGASVDAEAVVKHSYVTGLKIKNLSLSGGTKYTVTFPGVTDFLGNTISNYEFTTDVTVPELSISCKNPDAVYGEGDTAEFEIESAFLKGNNIDIYHNGEVYRTFGSGTKEFSVQLVGGNNEIYAKVSGLNLESQKVNIYIDNTPVINITCKNPDAVYEVGDSVKFSIRGANLKGNAIDIYNNGTKVDTISADATEFAVELVGGNNEIYAKVSALSLESQKLTIYVDNTPSVLITKQGTAASFSAGDSVKFTIESANLNGNLIEIYHNGLVADTLTSTATEFTIVISNGNNTVFAKVPALDAKSQTITILAEAMGPVGEVKFFDFENGTTEGIYSYGEKEGSIQVTSSDESYGKSLYFSIDGTKVDASVADNKPYIVADSVNGKSGIYVFEADLKFSQVEESGNIFPLKCKKSGSDVWNTLYVLEDGNIKLKTGTKETIYSGILPDVWYNLKATWNSETSTSDFYVNGVKVASGIPFSSKNIDSFVYVNMSIISKTGAKSSMYMDNIKSYFLGKMANVEYIFAGLDSSEVLYENTAITLKFDQAMNADSLKGIKLTSEIGKEILIDFATDDNLTFVANIATLSPNTNYTVDLSNVIAKAGVGVSSRSVSFKTKKAPFAIKSAKTTESGSNLKVDVSIQNNNGEEKSYIVIAALYSGNMMLSSDAKAYTSIADETPSFSFDKPNGDYEIEIYVFDSAHSLNLIDKLIVK